MTADVAEWKAAVPYVVHVCDHDLSKVDPNQYFDDDSSLDDLHVLPAVAIAIVVQFHVDGAP